MNVYITYDRYEHDEWFYVYNIETNRQRAIKHFKEVDLIDFISCGPDDCHSFQLEKVVMTKDEYKKVCHLVEIEKDCETNPEEELREILINIFNEDEHYEVETILCTDGCSDFYQIIEYYCKQNGLDYEDDDVQEQVQEELFSDDDLFRTILKEYISVYY